MIEKSKVKQELAILTKFYCYWFTNIKLKDQHA